MSTERWPARDRAYALLTAYTTNPGLLRHAVAVEAVMRRLAAYYNDDEELFGLVGLLHDFDYEAYPDIGAHTVEGGRILEEHGFPAVIVRAIQSHVTENGISRDSVLEKALFAADELTGFVMAATLVRPQKSLGSLTPASVIKKLKDKGFARGVNRQDVYAGAEGLGVELPWLIQFIIDALIPHAESIGVNP